MADAASVTFLNIGQGDATLIHLLEAASGIVVDCGSGGSGKMLDLLEKEDIQEIPLVILSHSDRDHVGGIMEVLDNFPGVVREIAVNHDRLPADYSERQYRHFLRRLAQYVRSHPECRRTGLLCPLSWTFGSLNLTLLHPEGVDATDAVSRNLRNESSAVVLLEVESDRVLLTADIEGIGWEWLLSRHPDLRARVFKLPHHGGWHASGVTLDKVLQLVEPEVMIISVGLNNQYGHPSPRTMTALVEYLDLQGSAEVFVTQLAATSHARIQGVGDITIRLPLQGVA
jgi:competence protein ComEC